MTAHPHAPQDAPARGDLIATLLAGLSRLLRGELELAKAEAARSMRAAARGAVFLAVALVLAFVALGALAAAAAAGLMAWGLSPPVALLATGGIFAVLCAGFGLTGAGMIKGASDMPKRSARNLSRDIQTLKSGVTSDATIV